MKLVSVVIRNFRRLEHVTFTLEGDHTIFVGPNNSGKTSAAAAFRTLLDRERVSINDFTVACITQFDAFGAADDVPDTPPPAIDLDLWFSVDPEIEYGRVSALLPTISMDLAEVGIRVSYSASNAKQLYADYRAAHPTPESANYQPLSQFLAQSGALKQHYGFRFFSLNRQGDDIEATEIPPKEGRPLVTSLVRVDFIDAQRNIRDEDDARSNRLSAAFAAYYKHNLQQPNQNEAAKKVIDENNQSLTAHYEAHFEPLLKTIALLGVPSAHDRTLQLISSLSPEEALQGSTELYYYDAALKHQLPESYNGLGFKNLIYMAIQMSHFHTQWLATPENRPLCQIIFVEEPEVHLHAQVQQIFINNMWGILQDTAKVAGEPEAAPQLAISTHSSHVVETAAFDKIRYFRRSSAKGAPAKSTLATTNVVNLKDFHPSPSAPVVLTDEEMALGETEKAAIVAAREAADVAATLRFLRKYLKLTHCDLFFADAAILVEGAGEKLLLPKMIDASAPDLNKRYLTVLEVGGAYAHKLSGLLAFLGIPYTVVADIDTVDPAQNRKSCRADTTGAHTSNATLHAFLQKKTCAELLALEVDQQVCEAGACFIGFQRPAYIDIQGVQHAMHARTLEEAIIHANLDLFLAGTLSCGIDLTALQMPEGVREAVYTHVKSGDLKKTEFALDLASADAAWKTPEYIRLCLSWLEQKLAPLPLVKPALVAAEPVA